jgi:hypothetical protein
MEKTHCAPPPKKEIASTQRLVEESFQPIHQFARELEAHQEA